MVRDGHDYKEVGDSIILYTKDYINDVEGEKLEELCSDFFDRGIKKVVMDFSGTELINSIGISILIGIIESVKERGGTLVFSGLESVNRNIFDMVGITDHVTVFGTEKEAIDGLNKMGSAGTIH